MTGIKIYFEMPVLHSNNTNAISKVEKEESMATVQKMNL